MTINYRIAVEDMEPKHWVAWALDIPGCFNSARTQEEAIALAPSAISRYFTWLKSHGYKGAFPREGIEIVVVERFQSYLSNGMYIVNAFFEDDNRPLEAEEVKFALWVLNRTREDLVTIIKQVPSAKLTQSIASQVHGSMLGILEHIAWSEWWYFDRLNLAFEREAMPSHPFDMLNTVREHSRKVFAELIGKSQIVARSGERWSPRKVMRRTIWHERDHTYHIEKLLTFI